MPFPASPKSSNSMISQGFPGPKPLMLASSRAASESRAVQLMVLWRWSADCTGPWRDFHTRAAAIAPGFIGTEMVMSMKPEARERIEAVIPARRVGDPDEIARAVQFIFENDYFSGRCIDVDGALRL